MNFNRKVLKNGLRIITVPIKNSPTATVLVLVEAGSKYESKQNNGISHFLEHMCFKGTTKRPSASDISKDLDILGAEYNAFTSQEYTGYYAKADYKSVDNILEIVSDLYLNPTFPDKEIEKEKGVIIEEINMYRDLPQAVVQDEFSKLLYGDTPAGWTIAGPKENIQKMKRADFIDYRNKHYVASATTVVVSGRFDEKTIIKKINLAFKNIGNWKKDSKKKVVENQQKPASCIFFKDTDQTHLVLGVRTFDTYKECNTTIGVLTAVLSGGMSSRLFQKLRDEMGICYYVRATNDKLTDHGVFSVSAGVDSKRVDEAINAILEEMRKMKTELVGKEELEKVKKMIVGRTRLTLESSDDIAEYYGGQEIMRKTLEKPEEKIKKIQAVTAEEIKRVANIIFNEKTLNLAIVGKFENKERFDKLLKL